MKIDFNGMVYALSYSLDCVEQEFAKISRQHAKWVAYISALTADELSFSDAEKMDLAACAALHDNALSQYIAEEKANIKRGSINASSHCSIGEKNLCNFPFQTNVEGAILYHHENANGSGPFGKTADETPLSAQIIHFCDYMDVACRFKDISEEKYDKILTILEKERGRLFTDRIINAFLSVMPKTRYLSLKDRPIDELLLEALPPSKRELTFSQIKEILFVFAKIIDFKSPFTRKHSMQIAEKVFRMGEFYHWDTNTCERLYIAGALHDIGKMAVTNDVLEKPDRLNETEFAYMQTHAWYTYKILSKIDGFEDITRWAALHHEKLNGKGYPFGKTADELDKKERLMGCVDIYQALTEDRPYKEGLPHEKCIAIMDDMVQNGFIDKDITADIDAVFGN